MWNKENFMNSVKKTFFLLQIYLYSDFKISSIYGSHGSPWLPLLYGIEQCFFCCNFFETSLLLTQSIHVIFTSLLLIHISPASSFLLIHMGRLSNIYWQIRGWISPINLALFSLLLSKYFHFSFFFKKKSVFPPLSYCCFVSEEIIYQGLAIQILEGAPIYLHEECSLFQHLP